MEKEEINSVAESEKATESMVTEAVAKKKRLKCVLFATAFTLFQIVNVLVFIFFVLRFKNPKFRLDSSNFEKFEINSSAPSFYFAMDTEFVVKNPNFGHFMYQMSNVTFEYRGIVVGVVSVDKARTRARSTRKIHAKVVLKADATNLSLMEFVSDVRSGKLPLTSSSKLGGKIELMKLIKKKKPAEMNCNMNVDIKTTTLQNILCN